MAGGARAAAAGAAPGAAVARALPVKDPTSQRPLLPIAIDLRYGLPRARAATPAPDTGAGRTVRTPGSEHDTYGRRHRLAVSRRRLAGRAGDAGVVGRAAPVSTRADGEGSAIPRDW